MEKDLQISHKKERKEGASMAKREDRER